MTSSILSTALALSVFTGFATSHNTSSDFSELCGRAHFNGIEFQSRNACPIPSHLKTSSEPSTWAPWTHKPFCTDKNVCVYTNSLFRRNRGISIITTPESIADTSALLDILFADVPDLEPHPVSYKVQEIPNKGYGVLATRPIKKWDIIMTDSASLLADHDLPRKLRKDEGVTLFSRAMNQLPDPTKLLNLSRSSVDQLAPAAEDVVRTNSFGLSLNDVERMVVFPKISRINHACAPNAAIRWSHKTLDNTIVALRDIEEGEEISISYAEFGLTYAQRQSQLKARWGFTCTCSLCSASPDEIEESDLRRERIKELRDNVLVHINKRQFRHAIKGHKEMTKLVQKERLVSQTGEHHWVLTKLYAAAGDRENTIKYAKMAYAELKRNQQGGTEMEDTMKELKQFLRQSKIIK